MKMLVVVALMLLLPLALAAQTQHLKLTQDGAFANLNASTDPNSSFSLQVAQSSSQPGGASATLSYSAFEFAPDFSTLTIVQIFGVIPASSLTAQNTQHIVLDFDTSQLDPSNSTDQSCTLDLNTLILTCGPGPTGQIQMDFQENGAQRTQVLALEQVQTFGSTTVRTHQKSDSGSANARGSIFGVPISSTSASVGVNRNSTLEIIQQ